MTIEEREKSEQMFSAPDPQYTSAVYYYADGKGGIVEKVHAKHSFVPLSCSLAWLLCC